MTREEFLDNVNSFWELREFCNDTGCPVMDDIYDSDSRNETIEERMYDWAREYSWREVLSMLQEEENEDGYDFYRDGDCGYLEGLSDELVGDYAAEALEWGDDHDIWDYDEDEEEQDNEYEPVPYEEEIDLTPIEDEDFSVSDLFAASGQVILAAKTMQKQEEKEDDSYFDMFVNVHKQTASTDPSLSLPF